MTFVFKPSENVKKKMIEYYSVLKRDKTPPYSILQAMDADTIITIYESGKVMFQGPSADIDVKLWQEMEKKLNNIDINLEDKNSASKKDKDVKPEYKYLKTISTAGSDEVGTGDYFGPIVVTASYVDKSKISLMEELGVTDSKKITDDKIKKIAPVLMKNIPYTTFKLSNEEFNKLDNKNMNKIKAILHNKVLVKLFADNDIFPEKVVIDQFVYPKKYYEHIKDAQKKVTNILFMTKAESQVYSVAASSIIARYLFLKEMETLSNSIGEIIPLGAGVDVDSFAKKLVEKHGMSILDKYAKKSFKNTEKLHS